MAFDNGDQGALEQLIYWGDLPEEKRTATRMYLIDNSGDQKIRKFDAEGSRADEFPPENWSLDPARKFEIEYGNESGSHTFGWPYGEHEGHFYLLAVDPDGGSK